MRHQAGRGLVGTGAQIRFSHSLRSLALTQPHCPPRGSHATTPYQRPAAAVAGTVPLGLREEGREDDTGPLARARAHTHTPAVQDLRLGRGSSPLRGSSVVPHPTHPQSRGATSPFSASRCLQLHRLSPNFSDFECLVPRVSVPSPSLTPSLVLSPGRILLRLYFSPCPFPSSLPSFCLFLPSRSSCLSLCPRSVPPRPPRWPSRARPQTAGRRPGVRPGWASAWRLGPRGERQLFAISPGPRRPRPPSTGRGHPCPHLWGGETPETSGFGWKGGLQGDPRDVRAHRGPRASFRVPSWSVLPPFFSISPTRCFLFCIPRVPYRERGFSRHTPHLHLLSRLAVILAHRGWSDDWRPSDLSLGVERQTWREREGEVERDPDGRGETRRDKERQGETQRDVERLSKRRAGCETRTSLAAPGAPAPPSCLAGAPPGQSSQTPPDFRLPYLLSPGPPQPALQVI
ncbi:uncharacterized protein LOC125107740 [Lutra lutra]|uniref:uncharacterized protein LOC125107740 n=1 Tax=Lutra lutra TaxID=9657 RepID=UPI001FD2F5B7|nr:uncharacterized protein LOC125107740 [Lutra lutra]